MNKSKIEWTDYVFNPIKGLCPVNCKTPDGNEYCYARKIYKRFDLMSMLYAEAPDRDWDITEDAIVFDEYEANQPYETRVYAKREIKPRKIFVCSTIEIFHPSIPKECRDGIFKTIEGCPQDTFQILTKMPENIDRPMPDNVHLGISITGKNDGERLVDFSSNNYKAKVKFCSIEPLLESLDAITILALRRMDWTIIGKLSGYGKKYDPEKWWIKNIIKDCKQSGVLVFLKDNLVPIIGKNLVMKHREFPKEE